MRRWIYIFRASVNTLRKAQGARKAENEWFRPFEAVVDVLGRPQPCCARSWLPRPASRSPAGVGRRALQLSARPGATAALPADALARRRRVQRRRRRRSGREGGRAVAARRPPRRHAHKSLETNTDARLAEEQRRQFERQRLRAVRRDAPRPLRPVINVAGARAEISGYVEGRPAVCGAYIVGGGHVTTGDGGLDAVAA